MKLQLLKRAGENAKSEIVLAMSSTEYIELLDAVYEDVLEVHDDGLKYHVERGVPTHMSINAPRANPIKLVVMDDWMTVSGVPRKS